MKNIVLIGNSVANIKVIEGIRDIDQESNIVLISADAFSVYGRDRALSFLAREIREKQVFEHDESFYKEHRVRLITGQAVTRFNFKRSQVFLENKEQVPYDILVLADIATPRLPDIKGHHKTGVYQALRLADVKSIAEAVPFADTIVVQVTSMVGFLTACALSRIAQNIVLCASSDLLPGVLDRESSDMLRQLAEASCLRLMLDNPIEEILGDSDAKAVRFRSGKVLASDLIILDDVRLDMRPLQETGLDIAQGDLAASRVSSNFPNVYLADAVLNALTPNAGQHYASSRAELENQGVVLAREISGGSRPQNEPVVWVSFKIKEMTGYWAGVIQPVEGGADFSNFDSERNVFKKIFTQKGVVTGIVCFNAEEEFFRILQLVNEKANIQGMEQRVLQGGSDLQSLKSASISG